MLEILYVEDNPAEVFLLASAIRKIDPGMLMTTAADGETALELIHSMQSRDHMCVIVLDLGLPKIDGAEVFRAVKSAPALKHVPTVIFAENSGRLRVEGTGYTPELFLTKPMDLEGYTKVAGLIVDLCNSHPPKAATAAV